MLRSPERMLRSLSTSLTCTMEYGLYTSITSERRCRLVSVPRAASPWLFRKVTTGSNGRWNCTVWPLSTMRGPWMRRPGMKSLCASVVISRGSRCRGAPDVPTGPRNAKAWPDRSGQALAEHLRSGGLPDVNASHQQRVHPLHISGGVFRQAAFGQQRLVKQDVGEVVEVRAALQLLHQRVLGVHFQDRLGGRRLLAGGLEHAGELVGQIALAHHKTGRRIDQARGHAHVLRLAFQRF